MSLHVQVERFEGPMGLLLHLIRREEMDIFDININQITRQYLDYIKAMKKLDLEMAGEFIAMAATLIQIKARMLLPQYDENGEELEQDDPRKDLVQKLLEYQMYQDASVKLYQRPLVGRDTWLRGQKMKLTSNQEEEIIVEENALFALISAYRTAVKNMKKSVHKVMSELQSISERILELKDQLIAGTKTSFSKILSRPDDRNQVLVTFLSLLELTRMGFVSIFQTQNFADIHIESKRNIDSDVISKAEGFEAANQTLAEEINPETTIDVTEEWDDDNQEVAEDQIDEKLEAQFNIASDEEDEDDIDPMVEAATDEEIEQEEQRFLVQDNTEKNNEGELV